MDKGNKKVKKGDFLLLMDYFQENVFYLFIPALNFLHRRLDLKYHSKRIGKGRIFGSWFGLGSKLGEWFRRTWALLRPVGFFFLQGKNHPHQKTQAEKGRLTCKLSPLLTSTFLHRPVSQ